MAHKLNMQEQQNIIKVLKKIRFAQFPPAQVVAISAEYGHYIALEMTIYRIMREEGIAESSR